MNDCRHKEIIINDTLLRKIVYAIDKAISDDLPQFLQDNHMETCNYIIQLRGDKINDNLRNHVVNEDIELVPFKRCVWSGRILVDRINHITYTITTVPTLDGIPRKKNRRSPHFLQSVLFAENSECKSPNKQMNLYDFGVIPFDTMELEADYIGITKGLINRDENYCHYIVAYKSEGSELKDVILKLLDKDFGTVDETSLNEYIKPDFSRLTEVAPAGQTVETEENTESKKLVAIKAGIIPKLREVEKQA